MKNVWIATKCSKQNQKRIIDQLGQTYHIYFGEEVNQKSCLQDMHIIIGEPDYSLIKDLKTLEWVQMTWAGTDKYTRNGPFPEGVLLTNASGAFGVIISEYIIGGILALYRRFPYYLKKQNMREWSPLDHEETIYGKNALILGAGNIGMETAKRLKAFGCHTYGIRRQKKETPYFDHIGCRDQIDQWLPIADIVVCCMPNNKESIDILTYERLTQMKKTSIIVNVGRGHIIEENAMERALEDKLISGAVLDVQRVEPLPTESILWKAENVIITPHIAGPSFSSTEDTQNRIYDIVIENLERYAQGQELINKAEFTF